MSVPGPVLGPCESWITGAEVAAFCGLPPEDPILDTVAVEASMALYEISGRQFSGLCTRTVRPCRQMCDCWPSSIGMGTGPWSWSTVPWGSVGSAWGWWNETGNMIGCKPLSRVKLSGYPVREILSVTIDGDVLPEYDEHGNLNYRLDEWRYLTRMDIPGNPPITRRWPSCQDMSLDSDQYGTFSVTYRWGVSPPQLGRDAACEIACQMLAARGDRNDCMLPAGVVKATRQGIEVERGLLANWFNPKQPTGLVHTDLFLQAYWSQRTRRRSALYSPDVQQYARPFGTHYTDG